MPLPRTSNDIQCKAAHKAVKVQRMILGLFNELKGLERQLGKKIQWHGPMEGWIGNLVIVALSMRQYFERNLGYHALLFPNLVIDDTDIGTTEEYAYDGTMRQILE